MIIKEYTAKDSAKRNRIFVDIECDCCKTVYTRQKRWVSETHGCTPKCQAILKGNSVFITCTHCGSKVNKRKSDLNKSKSGLQFCNRECKEAAQKYIKEIQPEHYGTGTGKYSYREKALEYYGKSCNRCGYSENIAAIEVHHKDRNRENNQIDNLEVLCSNCHSIEHRGS